MGSPMVNQLTSGLSELWWWKWQKVYHPISNISRGKRPKLSKKRAPHLWRMRLDIFWEESRERNFLLIFLSIFAFFILFFLFYFFFFCRKNGATSSRISWVVVWFTTRNLGYRQRNFSTNLLLRKLRRVQWRFGKPGNLESRFFFFSSPVLTLVLLVF